MEQMSEETKNAVASPQASDVSSSAKPLVGGNPFPGLRPYQEEEEHLFFGRERQVYAMVDKLAKSRFLAVVGTSGSGKSSLVNCGLRPALHRGLLASAGSAWRIVQFRPGNDPLKAMGRALAERGVLYSDYEGNTPLADIIDTHLRLSNRGLVDIVRKASLSRQSNLLIVVDQFEELFRYRNLNATEKDQFNVGQDATAFVNLLLEAQTSSDPAIFVALTMRSDFLGDCSQFHGLPEAINQGQFLVPRLTREERRAAIAGPVGVAGGDISPVLLTRLVNDVGDNPDQLSILQHALNRTWAYWQHDGQGEGPMSLSHYEAIGGMAHALDLHADKAYGELTREGQKKLCEKIFKGLTDKATDPRGIRRPLSLKTLALLTGATEDEVKQVISVFRKPSRSFVMPPLSDPLDPDNVVDISHESLMRVWRRLNTWADEEAEAAREYRRLSDRAEGFRSKRFGLMQDPDLQTALDFRARQDPTTAWADLYGGGFDQTIDFLSQSEERRVTEKADRELDRRWQLRWQPLIFAVVALGFLIVLLLNRDSLLPRPIEQRQQTQNADSKVGEVAADLARQTFSGNTEVAKDARKELAKSFLKVGGLTLAFALLYSGALRLGKRVHRRFALPAILSSVRNPVQASPAVRQQVRAPTLVEGVTYAPWWRRGLALAIDFLIGSVLLTLTVGVAFGVMKNENLALFGYLAWFMALCIYHVMTEGSNMQASLGMRALGTYVTDLNGRRLSRWGVLKKQLIRFLWFGVVLSLIAVPTVLSIVLGLWAVLHFVAKWRYPSSPFIRRRQWPSDLASKTVVLVGRPANLLPG